MKSLTTETEDLIIVSMLNLFAELNSMNLENLNIGIITKHLQNGINAIRDYSSLENVILIAGESGSGMIF